VALEDGLQRSRVLAIHPRHPLDVKARRLTHRLIAGVKAPDLIAESGIGGRVQPRPILDPLLPSACFAIEDGIGGHRTSRPCTLRLGEDPGLELFGARRASEDDELVSRFVADFGHREKASLQEELPGLVDRRRRLTLIAAPVDGMEELGNPFGQSGVLRAGLQGDEGREQLRKRHDGPPIRPGTDRSRKHPPNA